MKHPNAHGMTRGYEQETNMFQVFIKYLSNEEKQH